MHKWVERATWGRRGETRPDETRHTAFCAVANQAWIQLFYVCMYVLVALPAKGKRGGAKCGKLASCLVGQ